MKRLSIIVPMYNVAPYVERCIRSLEDQDIQKDEYEIICVNDGSPDNCREIVKSLQLEYPNVILINQENQGVSRARNNGINRATGTYLLFIDPDDFVDARSFSRILKNAEDNKAQVSFLGYSFLNVDGTIQKIVLNEEEVGKIVPGTEAYFLARGNGRTDPDRMVAVLFEREFMNLYNLRYLPDVPYLEDGELISRILCLAEKCIFDGHSFYQRTTRPGSATNSLLFYSDKAIDGFLKSTIHLKIFQDNPTLEKRQKIFLNQPICKFAILCLTPSLDAFNLKELLLVYSKLKGKNLGKLKTKGTTWQYTKLGLAYNASVFILLLYWAIAKGLVSIRIRLSRLFSPDYIILYECQE